MARHMFLTVVIVFSVYATLLFVIGHPFVVEASTNNAATQSVKKPSELTAEVERSVQQQPKKVLFKGPTIIGVKSRVDLTQGQEQVEQVWQTLLNNKPLQNNVDWSKGDIKVYAYYSDFNKSFTAATLSIGFDSEQLLLNSDMQHVTLPTGSFDKFIIDPNTGMASDEAWAMAFQHKNMIERHTLNRQGEAVTADVIVINL